MYACRLCLVLESIIPELCLHWKFSTTPYNHNFPIMQASLIQNISDDTTFAYK